MGSDSDIVGKVKPSKHIPDLIDMDISPPVMDASAMRPVRTLHPVSLSPCPPLTPESGTAAVSASPGQVLFVAAA